MLGDKLPSRPTGLDLQNILGCLFSQEVDAFFLTLKKALELQYKILLQELRWSRGGKTDYELGRI